METSTANSLISDHIIKAFCNTLMHSLWQGVLLAVIAGAIIIFTKKASAAYRYNLLIGALALFAGGVVFTFILQMQQSHGNTAAYVINTPGTAPVITHTITAPAIQQRAKEGLTETVFNYLNTHYNVIVLIWFLIICAKSVQMAVGLHGVYHLKRTSVFAVGKDWENRLSQLSEQLHIKQVVRLMESGIAKVPMVIGHLKPVVLIPIGLINSLTADEVEAILIHELAHIRRRDYLVNLLQGFMEIVFFFNPAVLWISQLIKTERENCCDDLAVSQSNNKASYISALVSCEEYQAGRPAYAMAFPGSKNTLLARVKRMMGNHNHSLNMFEKTVLAICLVVFGLGISAFSARNDIKKALKSVASIIHHDVKTEQAATVKVIKNDTTAKSANNNAGAVVNQLQQLAPSTIDTAKQAALTSMLTHKMDSARVSDAMPKSALAALAKMDTATFKRFHAIGLELYRERLVTDTNHLNISLNDHELIVNGVRMPQQVFERISRQFGRKGERGSYSGGYTNTYAPSGAPEPPSIVIPDFGDTLVKYGIVKDKRFIHVIFNSRGLIINGVKQPDDVFQMLFKKYGENTNITYTNNGSPDTRMEQNAYWAGQQRKIIDEMQREGLISNRKDLSFTLTDKTFVVNGLVQNGEIFKRYRHEYVPADAADNWTWNYPGPPGYYQAYANGYRNYGAYYQAQGAERRRQQEEIDKKLVADLLQDGLITDPNNVTFSLTDKRITINGKTQSDEVYKKYKEKYRPNSTGTNWTWSYSHHE